MLWLHIEQLSAAMGFYGMVWRQGATLPWWMRGERGSALWFSIRQLKAVLVIWKRWGCRHRLLFLGQLGELLSFWYQIFGEGYLFGSTALFLKYDLGHRHHFGFAFLGDGNVMSLFFTEVMFWLFLPTLASILLFWESRCKIYLYTWFFFFISLPIFQCLCWTLKKYIWLSCFDRCNISDLSLHCTYPAGKDDISRHWEA